MKKNVRNTLVTLTAFGAVAGGCSTEAPISPEQRGDIAEARRVIENYRALGNLATPPIRILEPGETAKVGCTDSGKVGSGDTIPLGYCPEPGEGLIMLNPPTLTTVIPEAFRGDRNRVRATIVAALIHESQHYWQRKRDKLPVSYTGNLQYTEAIELDAQCVAGQAMAMAYGPDAPIIDDAITVMEAYELTPGHGTKEQYIGSFQHGVDTGQCPEVVVPPGVKVFTVPGIVVSSVVTAPS